MRTYTYNNVTITYQDQIVWLNDSNMVTIESNIPTDKVGGEITVRHPNGTETRTIRYMSELNKLVFVLDDALAVLDDGNIGSYTLQIDVWVNNTMSFTKTASFQLMNGKSFTNQSHGISRTMYIYDQTELTKVQIYSPSSGVLSIGGDYLALTKGLNQYNMSQYINDFGTYGFCLVERPVQPIAVISGDTAVSPTESTIYYSVIRSGSASSSDEKGGDVWKYEETLFPVCHNIVYEEACWNSDFVEFRYKDTDGCTRYLGGVIASETNKVGKTMYWHPDGTNVYRNVPFRFIDSTQRSIKVCLQNISKDAYPQDIIYSETVEMRMYNSEWWPVVINSDSITVKNEDTLDIELDIIISND